MNGRQSQKNLALEGLRGIAAFVVVVSHLQLTFYVTAGDNIVGYFAWLPSTLAWALQGIVQCVYNGPFAVWLFWIMSAFVLSLQFFQRAKDMSGLEAHDYLEDAFLRRYPRLFLPVAVSVAFAYLLHSLGLMRNLELAHLIGRKYEEGWLGSFYAFQPHAAEAAKTAVWHCFFSGGYAGCYGALYNSVLWTMRNELFGSVFLFAFLALLGHRRSRYFIYPIIIGVNYVLDLHWLNSFVAGIVLCDVFVNKGMLYSDKTPSQRILLHACRNRILTFLVWLCILIAIGLQQNMPFNEKVLCLLIGTIAVAVTVVSKWTQGVLSSRVPVFLGKISFGLYLVHFPIICSFSCWLYLATHSLMGTRMASVLTSFLTCVLSIALAYFFYRYIDNPSVRLSRWLSFKIMNKSIS